MTRRDPNPASLLSVGLRLICILVPEKEAVSSELARETLSTLREQDNDYRCGDYVDRYELELERGIDGDGRLVTSEPMDAGCRQIMCDWCYKVCDISELPLTREMVAVTFSYLDRFLDRQPFCCDRTSFRLAVVTSFYIATKIMSPNQISISSLCALGRGSFTFQQIQEMEMILLAALDWRMNPPTAQAMVASMRCLFPSTLSPKIADAIFQRAIFFTELAIYDHNLISTGKHLLAVASVINGMEYLEDKRSVHPHDRETFASFSAFLCRDLSTSVLQQTRVRLWSLYHHSTQGLEEIMIEREYDPPRNLPCDDDNSLSHPQSPRCVESLER